MHTTVAIKKARHTPSVNLHPTPYHTAAQQPPGVYSGAPILSDRSDKSDRSDASATPTQPAHRRCHKKSPAHPNGKSAPKPNHTAAQQTLGVSHGLPRRSPSGRRRAHQSLSYKSYKSYKSYVSATPPQPAHRRCHHIARIPLRQLFAHPPPHSGLAKTQSIRNCAFFFENFSFPEYV